MPNNQLSNIVSLQNVSSLTFQLPSAITYDTDAQTYFTATGIVDTSLMSDINTLVLAAKANGWWTRHKVILPVPDATQAHCAVNLKSPGTFDLTFVGGWTFASTGMTPDGATTATSRALTGYIPSTHGTLNAQAMSIYSRTANSLAGVEMGATDGTNRMQLYCKWTDNLFYGVIDNNTYASYTPASSQGLFTLSRTSSTLLTAYRNGSSAATNTTASSARISRELYIGANNASGAFSEVSAKEIAFAAICDGSNGVIDSTIAAAMYTDIQAYQTSRSRQV